MTNFYRFPAMAKLDEYTNSQQLDYIQDEVEEAQQALGQWTQWRKAYGMELMDVIHATETALRMEFDDKEVEQLRDAVIEKNRKRGYYDD